MSSTRPEPNPNRTNQSKPRHISGLLLPGSPLPATPVGLEATSGAPEKIGSLTPGQSRAAGPARKTRVGVTGGDTRTLKLVWRSRAITLSHGGLDHHHGKKGEFFCKRGVACLLPWPEVPLIYIEHDATGQDLKSCMSAPLRGVQVWQSTSQRNVQLWQSTSLCTFSVGCTFLTVQQIQQRWRHHFPESWLSGFPVMAPKSSKSYIPPGVVAFVDPLSAMTNERGSPEPVAWLDPESNSIQALTSPEPYSARDSTRPKALANSEL